MMKQKVTGNREQKNENDTISKDPSHPSLSLSLSSRVEPEDIERKEWQTSLSLT